MAERRASFARWAGAAAGLVVLAALAWRLGFRSWADGGESAPPKPVSRQEWNRRLQEGGDGVAREKTYRAAADAGGVEGTAFLAEAGQSSEPTAHLAAAALGRVKDPAARPALRTALASPSVMVASNAARALGAIGHPEDFPPLRSLAEGGDRSRLWHEAVRALGGIRHPGARAVLESLLEAVRGTQERMSVMAGLASAARAESVPALERFLGRADLAPDERAFAEGALKACRPPERKKS